MLNKDFKYKLATVLEVCKIHDQRMQYALNFLKDIFPVNSEFYQELSLEQISHTDQLIYRFSQLHQQSQYLSSALNKLLVYIRKRKWL